MARGPLPLPILVGLVAVLAAALFQADEIRARADAALGRGMPVREAELARGFVLGADDQIDPRTVEDFRRAGLAHLLAVSGQNVALLAMLAMPVLAALGIPLRARLAWVLALIALYVPLAGAGPSIQRAAVMGALSVLATLAGRRASRFYALALAAFVTLALEPGLAHDVGWQLSFAAVLGILLVARPLRDAIAAAIGGRGWRGALADGAAMTIAATLATAPLISFHFGAFSTTTLVANLLALPAVAPSMWLGMLVAGAGQVPGFPVAALNAFNAPLLAYIAQVAAWCGRPEWAYLDAQVDVVGLIGAYAVIVPAAVLLPRLALRRHARRPHASDRPRPGRRRLPLLAAGAAAAIALAWLAVPRGAGEPPALVSGLRITFLDVGQGDSILLQPAEAAALLVDTGPAGSGIVAKLRAAGVERLGAAIVSHDQSDHAGGLAEILGALPVGRVFYGRLGRETAALVRAARVPATRLATGDTLRSGRLRLDVLWPPGVDLDGSHAVDDPNPLSVVLRARWGRFALLLGADAEAEAVRLAPGPVDVLKVAHHGSEDGGLDRLLAEAAPRLAVISVGAGNPFGHPAPETLATLAAHGVPVLRTDRDGAVRIEVGRSAMGVETER